jgi:hypothetical protein
MANRINNLKSNHIKFDGLFSDKTGQKQLLDSYTMSNVVYPSNFDTKRITISALRSLQSGAKSAYLNYGGERLVMQSAVSMSVPFGLNCADKFGPPTYSVELSFRGHEQRPEIKQFMETMNALDEFMLNEGVKNSKLWFKADLSRDVVKAFYTPLVKYSKDKDGNVLSYPPNIKLKLPKNNDEFEAKFYDVNGTPYKGVPVQDLLVKGVQVTAIMECTGVWFAGSKYGLTWKAKQIAVHKLPERIGDFAFKGLGSAPVEEDVQIDDDEVFKKPSVLAAVMPSKAPTASVSAAGTIPTSEQDEDEVDDEDADDVEPVPAPKKTIIKKKVIVTGAKK